MSKAETGEAERIERERKTGLAAYKNKDFKAAIRHLEKARKVSPDDISILVALGGAYLHIKDYQKSVDACEKVVRLCEGRPEGNTPAAEALATLSHAYFKLGDAPRALKCYRRSLVKYHGDIFSKLDKSKLPSKS